MIIPRTGVFLGIIMISVHFPGFKFSFCTRSWLHVCFYTLFTVLFGACKWNFAVLNSKTNSNVVLYISSVHGKSWSSRGIFHSSALHTLVWLGVQ